MGNIVAVQYRLFEGEEIAVAESLAGDPHEFGGEILLNLEGGEQLFISWGNEPVQHSIAIRESSFFVPDAALGNHDVSASPFWAPMLGRPVATHFADPEHQVLRLSSSAAPVFACAYERGGWYADAVTICRQVPEHGA